jgi:type I restriction enzyme S subunit
VNIQLQIGDLLITKDGTIGKVAYLDVLPEPSTLNSGIFVLRPKRDSYDSGFLFYMLRSRLFSDFVAGLSAGSTINHLYQKDLSTLKFLVPDELSEQRAIAAILFDIDSELEALELRLGSVRAIKQGMVQELLSGRSRDRKATTAA